MSKRNRKAVNAILIGAGGFFALWALAAMIGGLHRVNWQLTELIRQGLVASGLIQPIHTLVDFYSHIKGIEYIICVVFFVAFPVFYRYVDKQKSHIAMSVKTGGSKKAAP